MKKTLISIALTSIIASSSTLSIASQQDEASKGNKPYTAIGVGAASGALLAGPVGLIVGGIVGGIIGRDNDEAETPVVDNLAESESVIDDITTFSDDAVEDSSLMVASADNSIPVVPASAASNGSIVKDIISKDLTMDVYFKAGSIDFENFYSPQLSVIANLLNEIPGLKLNLDGYSDRQGDENDNLKLSAERLLSVRDYFVNNGIDENRITLHAHGEKNFISKPGDLGAYVFDRRVVVSFEAPAQGTNNNVAAVSETSSL